MHLTVLPQKGMPCSVLVFTVHCEDLRRIHEGNDTFTGFEMLVD